MPEVVDHLPLGKYQMTMTQCLAKTCAPPLELEKRPFVLDSPVTTSIVNSFL